MPCRRCERYGVSPNFPDYMNVAEAVANEVHLNGQTKDKQSITADWAVYGQRLIEGVRVQEIRNVMKNNGYLTEIYRRDWQLDGQPVDQVFQVVLTPGGLSAWHLHQRTTDRLFANVGTVKVVLYDPRPESPTYGQLNEFRISPLRPQLIVVPPQVIHGVQNIGTDTAILLNLVDEAYQYEDPDHWRVPHPTPEIPYRL